MQFDSEIA